LARSGQRDLARSTLKGLLEHARLAPRHYHKAQADWLAQARRELDAL
jgi:hypothetical protein